MDPQLLANLPLVLIGLGLAAAGARLFVLTFKLNINVPAFMAMIKKLVLAGTTERAIKLCNAAPNALVPPRVKGVLIAWTNGKRTRKEMERAYDKGKGLQALGKLRLLNFVGAALLLAGVADMLVSKMPFATKHYVASGILLLMIIKNELSTITMRGQLDSTLERLFALERESQSMPSEADGASELAAIASASGRKLSCPKCGAPIIENFKFCRSCGAQL